MMTLEEIYIYWSPKHTGGKNGGKILMSAMGPQGPGGGEELHERFKKRFAHCAFGPEIANLNERDRVFYMISVIHRMEAGGIDRDDIYDVMIQFYEYYQFAEWRFDDEHDPDWFSNRAITFPATLRYLMHLHDPGGYSELRHPSCKAAA